MIGEALIDLILRPGEPEQPVVGGSPLNVAVGLARLGLPAALSTHLGADKYGAMITRHLEDNGVSLAPGSMSATRTSLAKATIGTDGTATYDFDIIWDLTTAPPTAQPEVVHAGSISAVVAPGAAKVTELVSNLRSSATITYDPNVRPALMGGRRRAADSIESLVELADVVKASDEDLACLYPGVEAATVAHRWAALGPALVVITRGELGACAVTEQHSVEIAARGGQVRDTIGAGDSFMAGLIAALDDVDLLGRRHEQRLRSIDAETLERVVTLAASCAAVTVSRVGADPPTRADVMAARSGE